MSSKVTRLAMAGVVVSAMLLVTLVASGGAGAGTAGPAKASVSGKTLCISMKTQLQRRWGFDVRAIQQEAKALGDTTRVTYANDDPAAQSSQVESMITRGCNALIIVPVDLTAAAAIVSYSRGQGVPVVAYDSMINSTQVSYIVQRGNVEAGMMQAREALKYLKNGGNIAIIKGDASTGVAQEMSSGYTKVLTGVKRIKVVYNQFTKNWDPTTAETAAENVLSANKDNIQGVISMNDGMATGILQALKSAKLAGKVFISGMDSDPANLRFIAQGYQTMTLWTPIDVEGVTAAKVAAALAAGRKPKPEAYLKYKGASIPEDYVHVVVLNKSNLCKFITKIAPKGWITVANVFPGKPHACG